MTLRFHCNSIAIAMLAIVLAACSKPPPVIDRQILLCPPKVPSKPECVEPPETGTERSQADVFANEMGCYRRVLSWDRGWKKCSEAEGEKGL